MPDQYTAIEFAAAHEANNRLDLAAALSDAGHPRANDGEMLRATSTGFTIVTDRTRTERTGHHTMKVSHQQAGTTHGAVVLSATPTETDQWKQAEASVTAYAETLNRAGGWHVEQSDGDPGTYTLPHLLVSPEA